MFVPLKGLLSPTDRKNTDQLNPCEENWNFLAIVRWMSIEDVDIIH